MRKCLIHFRASFFIVFIMVTLGLPTTPVHAAKPTVTTPETAWASGRAILSATSSDVTIGATISATGGPDILAHGTVWGTGAAPTSNPQDSGSAITGAFQQDRIGLPAGSLIYFRGFATNTDGTGYSPDGTFYTEPATPPTGVAISNIDYFTMTVSWDALPTDTDGVLVVMQALRPVNEIPYDGAVYAADAVFGAGNELKPYERDYVVYNGAGTSVAVTNLQADVTYYVALFAYKGSGTGSSGINYVNDFTVATATATTLPTTGLSHNEQNITDYTESTGCANCHGSHHTIDLLSRGLAQYNRCFVCHSSGGGANPNIGLHLADGSIDCGTCHTMHSFRTSELYSNAAGHGGAKGFNQKFIRSNMSKYINTTDFTPPSGPPKDALDNTVFQSSPAHFAFTTGGTPYNGVCQTCHTETNFHTQTGVSDNTHQVGNNCVNCHAHSSSDEYNAFRFSGHTDTDFGWSGNCQDCHGAGAGAEAVVSVIHANNCDLCHTTGGPYNSSTEKAGDNGDGDATAADGAAADTPKFDDTVYNCILCHAPANAGVIPSTTGGIHHNNTGTIPYDPSQCTACHTAVDHVSMIADVPGDCNSCHTLTEAQANINPPLSTGDPKVHDMCVSCHVFAASPDYKGDLVTIGTAAKGLPTGKLPAGGGDCIVCHSGTGSGNARLESASQIHHITPLATSGNCQVCHLNDGTSGGTGVGSYNGGAVETINQLACRQCHVDDTANGLDMRGLRLGNSSGLKPESLDNGAVTTHAITHTSPIPVQDYRACFACHNGSDTGGYAGDAAAAYPFHGYPGDLAQGTLVLNPGDAITRKTVLAGGANWSGQMPINEYNGNSLPLVFQYYHPGHRASRRFSTPGPLDSSSSTFDLTRRGSNQGYDSNTRLYWDNFSPRTSGNTDIGGTIRTAFDWGNTFSTGESIRYGGAVVGTGAWNTKNTAGTQWEAKGYSLFFTAPYTRFNSANKPADTTEIPYFTALAAPNDRVFINSAIIDAGGNLLVIASNDEGCDKLTVTTQADGTDRGTMTLNAATGYCEKAVSLVSPIPATVDVTSSGTGTPSVTGFLVTDNS